MMTFADAQFLLMSARTDCAGLDLVNAGTKTTARATALLVVGAFLMLPFPTEREREMELWKVCALLPLLSPYFVSSLLICIFCLSESIGKNVEDGLTFVGGLLGS